MRRLSVLVALCGCSVTQVLEVESTAHGVVVGVVDDCGYRELGHSPGRFVIRRSDVAFLRAAFKNGIVRYFALSRDPTMHVQAEHGLPDLKTHPSPNVSTMLRREIEQRLRRCDDVRWRGDPNGRKLEEIRVATHKIVAESKNAGLAWLLENLESMCAARVQIEPKGALPLKLMKLSGDIEIDMRLVVMLLLPEG